MWKSMGLLLRKNHLELTFSSKLDWGSYIITIAKAVSNKIRALICTNDDDDDDDDELFM